MGTPYGVSILPILLYPSFGASGRMCFVNVVFLGNIFSQFADIFYSINGFCKRETKTLFSLAWDFFFFVITPIQIYRKFHLQKLKIFT